jgi:hypothetical protein
MTEVVFDYDTAIEFVNYLNEEIEKIKDATSF